MFELVKILYTLLCRELTVYMRYKGEWVSGVLFFVIIASLFPITMGSQQIQQLAPASGGIIWISALLATLLSQEGLFRVDYRIGWFDQLFLSPYPSSLLILIKLCAHWLMVGLPLVCLGPILGMAFNLPTGTSLILMLTLLLGTPAMSLLGAIGVSLTLSLPRGGILLAILVLPLYVPILVLGASAITMSLDGFAVLGHLALIAAITLASILLAPSAISAAIRASLL